MAVEKLILRSILYGADKIPDSWFEKLPGGYYRDSHGHKRKIGDKTPKRDDPKSTVNGRKAESGDFYPERNYSERGRGRHRDRDRGRRTSSYDGGADEADDEYYYYREDGRPYRSKSRRRRSTEGDRHGHRRHRYEDERHTRPRHHDDRHRGAPPPSSREPGHGRRHPTAYLERPPDYIQPRSFGARADAEIPQYLRSNDAVPVAYQPPPPPINRNGPISNGYVPYAHIYGNVRRSAFQQEPSPEPCFMRSAMRDRGSPIRPHSQTRFAQQAPPADSEYTARAAFDVDNSRSVNGPAAYHSNRYGYDGLP